MVGTVVNLIRREWMKESYSQTRYERFHLHPVPADATKPPNQFPYDAQPGPIWVSLAWFPQRAFVP